MFLAVFTACSETGQKRDHLTDSECGYISAAMVYIIINGGVLAIGLVMLGYV